MGQKIPTKQIQIWDHLSKKNISCGVWGTMNSKYKKNDNLNLYFPDPWNFRDKLFPKKLNYLFYLPNYYSKNYLKFSKVKIFFLGIIFFYGIIVNKSFWYLIKQSHIFFKFFLKRGFKNYILFFIFDLISLNIIHQLNKKKKIDFLVIFLNSLAHFQHNNWDEKKIEEDYFIFVDKICKIILKIKNDYNSLIVFNGFTQKKIKTEYLVRPKNPKSFLHNLDIKFVRFEQDMTNGALIFFKSKKELERSFRILGKYKFFGLNVFSVKKISKKSIFYKFKIKFFKKKFFFENFKRQNIKRIVNYYTKQKISFDKKYSKKEYLSFMKQIELIKTTGIHTPEGTLMYKNININNFTKSRTLENHKIFYLIKNFFKK